jgi:hypothetical protein
MSRDPPRKCENKDWMKCMSMLYLAARSTETWYHIWWSKTTPHVHQFHQGLIHGTVLHHKKAGEHACYCVRLSYLLFTCCKSFQSINALNSYIHSWYWEMHHNCSAFYHTWSNETKKYLLGFRPIQSLTWYSQQKYHKTSLISREYIVMLLLCYWL